MNQDRPPTDEYVPDERESGAPSEPDWLRDMSGDQEPPDWVRRLFEDEETEQVDDGSLAELDERSVEPAPAAPEPPGVPEPPAVPEPAAGPEPAARPFERSETDDLRRWLRESEGEPGVPADKEEMPDWLQALDATGESMEPTPPDSTPPPASEEGDDIPDWLRELEEEAQRSAAPEPTAEAAAADSAADDASLPAWLLALDDQGPADERAAESAELVGDFEPGDAEGQAGDDLPDWLQEMSQEVVGPPRERAPLEPEPDLLEPEAVLPEPEGMQPEPALPEGPEPEAELPEELFVLRRPVEEDLTQEGERVTPVPEPDQAPAWLSELDQELSVVAAGDEFPDWLSETQEPPEVEEAILDLPQEAQAGEAETPEWMEELRAEQDQAGALEPPPELQVETSGPLAGLAGLLTPQPVAGMTSRSEAKPAPVVPEAHHELAARIRELLSEPPTRPELPALASERTVVNALGRWAIYLALIAVIVVAMFVPALHERILPPETQAGQDFYYTLRDLPPGSEVLLIVDYDAAYDGELTLLTRVLLWNLVRSGQRVLAVSHTPQGAGVVQDLLESRAVWAYGPAPVAGEQVLNLGYLPPHPAAMQAFMANPLGGATLWGGSVSATETALGREIERFEQLDALVLVSANAEHARWWIEQTAIAGAASTMPALAGVSAAIAPSLLPYAAGSPNAQLSGVLVGLAGAAEYEELCRAPFSPNARQNMILQGSAQMLLAAIVLVSGISFVVGRVLGKGGRPA